MVNGLVKYHYKLRCDNLKIDDPRYKPMHLRKSYREPERQIEKQILKSSYYKGSKKDQSWRKLVPTNWRFQDFGQRKSKEMEYTTVLEVPNTEDGSLLKRLAKKEPSLSKITNFQVKYIEQSGTQLANIFPRKMIPKRCDRQDCTICLLHRNSLSKGSSGCKQSNVVYRASCQTCESEISS